MTSDPHLQTDPLFTFSDLLFKVTAMQGRVCTETPPGPLLLPSQGLSISTQPRRLDVETYIYIYICVSKSHTPQLCTWNCSHSSMAVNPHTCSHLRHVPLVCHHPTSFCCIHQLLRLTRAEKAGGWEKKARCQDSSCLIRVMSGMLKSEQC